MSVRHGLLAILDQGHCYGYQLRAEYERRTGASVNVGQIYTTLERLERDGLVAHRGADEHGHVYWGVTDSGRDEVGRWFGAPTTKSTRDELARKIALSMTLPGVDAIAVVAAQRAASAARLAEIDGDGAASDALPGAIVRAADRAHARAEVEWLDAAAGVAVEAEAFGLTAERPRRGRPARERASGAALEADGAERQAG